MRACAETTVCVTDAHCAAGNVCVPSAGCVAGNIASCLLPAFCAPSDPTATTTPAPPTTTTVAPPPPPTTTAKACLAKGTACTAGAQCCSFKCAGGRAGKTCQ